MLGLAAEMFAIWGNHSRWKKII